jgi:uncharacterized protein YcnI
MKRGRRIGVGSAIAVLTLLVAVPASAHVSIRTDNNVADSSGVYTIRVPNESDTASTVRVEVQMPEGMEARRYEAKPGWDISIADGVLIIAGGPIAPGEFAEFRFQAANPATPGEVSFASIQTYDDGEVVNWTGAADGDNPAPTVEIVAASGEVDEHGDDHSAGTTEEASEDGTDVLTIVALVIGGLGVLLGGAALITRKK